MALVINENCRRDFPEEGGLYVWSKKLWRFPWICRGLDVLIYTIFLFFRGCLLASVAMSAYVLGGKARSLHRTAPIYFCVFG